MGYTAGREGRVRDRRDERSSSAERERACTDLRSRPARQQCRRARSSTPTATRKREGVRSCSSRAKRGGRGTRATHLADLVHGAAGLALDLAALGHGRRRPRRAPLGVEQAPKVAQPEPRLVGVAHALARKVENDGDLHRRKGAVPHRARRVVDKVERRDLAVGRARTRLAHDLLDEVHLVDHLRARRRRGSGSASRASTSRREPRDARCRRRCTRSS